MTTTLTMGLSILAAACFMAATWCMKLFSATPAFIAIPVIILFLGLGAWLEIEILRATRMGHVAVLVLAIELVLTFAIACTFLGERYSLRELAGVAVIIAGMVMLSSGSGNKPSPSGGLASAMPAASKDQTLPDIFEPQAFRTSTPGSTLPSIHSRNAPPAVEM